MAERGDNFTDIDPVRLVMRERDDFARRLAAYEYGAMRDVLLSGHAFDLPRLGGARRLPGMLCPGHAPAELAALQVPLSRVAVHHDPAGLPAFGVVMDDAGPASVGALTELIRELHMAAFARILFLPRCLTLVPFLSRFGFACECVGDAPADQIGSQLARRYGLSQIRDLRTGEVVWAS